MSSEIYQVHCSVCFCRFEADSLPEVLRKGAEHEAKEACKRPSYDPKDGRWTDATS